MNRPRTAAEFALQTNLDAWIRQCRIYRALRILAWVWLGAVIAVLAAMAADLGGEPWSWPRQLFGGMAVVGLLGGPFAAATPWLRRDYHAAARDLERTAGLIGEPLSGALALTIALPAGASAWMAERTVALAAVAAHGLKLRRLVPWRHVRRPGIALVALLAVLLTATLASPMLRVAAVRALQPWRELPPVGQSMLIAEPGSTWQAYASMLNILVRDPTAGLEAELLWADGTAERRALRTDADGGQRLQLGPLTRDLRWRVRGSGASSPWHQTRLVATPRIAGVALRIVPPAYTGLADMQMSGGDADVVAGSQVEIEVSLDDVAAVTAAVVAGEEQVPMTLMPSSFGSQTANVRISVASDLRWHLRLIVPGGAGGVVVEPPQRWLLRAVPDAPPAIAAHLARDLAAPTQPVRIAVEAHDDVALAAMWLESLGDGPSVRIPVPVPTGARLVEDAVLVVPADFAVGPGDRVRLVPVARDRGGNETRGDPLVLRVAQPVLAAWHDLAGRLAVLHAAAEALAADAADSERAWRTTTRSWRADDPAATAPSLRAMRARAAALADAVTRLADDAATDAAMGGSPASLDAVTSRAVAARVLVESLGRQAGEAENGSSDALALGLRDASTLAEAADAIAGVSGRAAAAVAAQAAAIDAEAAQTRLDMAVAMLTAESTWIRPAWRNGLAGRYWAGSEPGTGSPAYRAGGMPAVDGQAVPSLGRSGWCARWDGELLIPRSGRWHLAGDLDGGMRLRIDGQELFDDLAWRTRTAQACAGSRDLTAGWHAISIDFVPAVPAGRLAITLGDGQPGPLAWSHLRHRIAPTPAAVRAMSELPPFAASAAAERARSACADLCAAVDAMQEAVGRALRSPTADGGSTGMRDRAVALADRVDTAVAGLRTAVDWSDLDAAQRAAAIGLGVLRPIRAVGQALAEASFADRPARSEDSLAALVRAVADRPGLPASVTLARTLSDERLRLADLAGDLSRPGGARAAALAAAWAIDDLRRAVLGDDIMAVRAATAVALPLRAQALRQNADDDAPAWPPSLLRLARDRLRAAALALRHDGNLDAARRSATEAAWAAELETLRPGITTFDEPLVALAGMLHDQAVRPQADDLADLAEQCENCAPAPDAVTVPTAALAADAAARRTATAQALAADAAALHDSVPAMRAAGFAREADRAAALAARAGSLASAPEAASARDLAAALADTLAAPLARAIADGRLDAGTPAALVGRRAAQAAANARALALAVSVPVAAPTSPPTRRPGGDSAAQAAATADFPEEQRAAIRAYLRRLGGGR